MYEVPETFILYVGGVLSIFTVWFAGQLASLPALSFTLPGDKFVQLPSQFIYHEALAVQPDPPVSVHVPTRVRESLVHELDPPLEEQLGAVLSILTV